MPRPSAPLTYLPAELASAGAAQAQLLDLYTGQNPYGPPPHVLEAARAAVCERSPDALASAARSSIAERFGVTPERVLPGAGASELAWSAARALVRPGGVWLSIEPAQSPCVAAARSVGARITRWRSVERTGHSVDLEQVAELMRLEQPGVVSLCAPGSPTGASVPVEAVFELAARFADVQFVVDQSWLPLSDDHADLERVPPDNVLCLRSLTLSCALPGLRAGYALGSSPLLAAIADARPPFAVSAPALAALAAAVQEDEHITRCRHQLQADRSQLRALLDTLGLAHTPSVVPFALVRVARAAEVSAELRDQHHIAVCDATPFGLPDHLRISAPPTAAAPQLQTALERVLERRKLVNGREA